MDYSGWGQRLWFRAGVREFSLRLMAVPPFLSSGYVCWWSTCVYWGDLPLISSVYIHLHIKRKFQDMHTHHLKQAFFCSFLCPRFYLASCLHFDNCCLISFSYIDWQPKIFICRNVHTLASIQYMMLYDNDVLLLY